MTDKTLDEQVAEALGWELKLYQLDMGGNHQYTIRKGAKEYWDANFFTQSISNCKKYIQPVLMNVKYLSPDGININGSNKAWIVQGHYYSTRGIIFKGIGETEEIAYCRALLDKVREEK